MNNSLDDELYASIAFGVGGAAAMLVLIIACYCACKNYHGTWRLDDFPPEVTESIPPIEMQLPSYEEATRVDTALATRRRRIDNATSDDAHEADTQVDEAIGDNAGVSSDDNENSRISSAGVSSNDNENSRISNAGVSSNDNENSRISSAGVSSNDNENSRISDTGVSINDNENSRISDTGVSSNDNENSRISTTGVSSNDYENSRTSDTRDDSGVSFNLGDRSDVKSSRRYRKASKSNPNDSGVKSASGEDTVDKFDNVSIGSEYDTASCSSVGGGGSGALSPWLNF